MCFQWFQPLKNLFLKIRNGEVVENIFSEKMIHDLLESHNFSNLARSDEKKVGSKIKFINKIALQ